MKLRLFLAATAVLAALLAPAHSQGTVDPPSELKFKILNENTVQMTWVSPLASIDGYRIQVTSDTEEPDKQLALPSSATRTSITDLRPDVAYTVVISSYYGAQESLPVTGQLTSQSPPALCPSLKLKQECSVSAVADLVFVVDGSRSVGKENFKHIRSVVATVAGAFEIGADKTRVGVVQYSSEVGPHFPLKQHLSRGELLRAINSLPYKGGEVMTGVAMDYVLKNSFSEEAGARAGFPKVAVVISTGRSQDSVEIQARKLRSAGVEVFVLGIKEADAEEMALMASTPHRSHVYSVADVQQIRGVHKALVTQVCAGVDDQLSSLVSGEEVVEPANNLQVLEFASKSMRLSWDPSFGEVSGYKIQIVPMISGPKRQELYVGHSQTSLLVRDLTPETQYQISVFALNGLTPSEPVTTMGKTESVQVSLECSLGVDVQADVVLLVDGSYSIGLANFAKVRAFLEVLVKSFDIGATKVQISLVQYSRDPHTEFHLNTHRDLDNVVNAVRTFPYRGGSTNTGRAMTYVREKIFLPARGARASVPRVAILITDGKSSDAFKEPATRLRNADVEIFAVGVKEAVRSELVAIANTPADTHVYTVDDFDAFQRISKELTQSICLRIEQELRNIQKRNLLPPRSLTFSEVGTRSFRATWATDTPSVESYLVQFRPANNTDEHFVSVSVPGDTLTSVLPHLTPNTRYEVNVLAQYDRGESFPVSGYETTLEEQGPVRGLKVSDETTDSFRVSWLPAPGAVLRYRLSYEATRGDGARLETAVPGGDTAVVLRSLLPQTTYRVTVTPEYGSADGPAGQTHGTTKEARGSPRDLRVSDETTSTMRLGWAPAPGNLLQYRVAFRPAAGGPRKEVSVKGETTGLVLKNLRPGTEYEVSVRARYPTGLGDPLEGRGTTLEETSPPRDLVTDDVTQTSFSASWTPATGPVRAYRVLWKSLLSQETGEKTVPGDQTQTPLEGLTPETLYQVSVVAVYPRGESPALLGQETTDASAAGKALSVTEQTEDAMRVTWTPAPGRVSHYRLKYVPRVPGGREATLKVPGTLSSTLMKRLRPVTTYDITVHPMYRHGEGKARQGVGTTLSPYKAPRNLQTSEPTKTSFRVSWDPAPGDVKGYKVTFHPIGNDVDLGEMLVGPHDNTIVLEELRAGTEYSVAVSGVFDNGVSLPLAGEEKTTLVDVTEPPLSQDVSDAKCKTNAKADIILLVDGSWSIGRLNFKTIRSFIGRMVGVFDIGRDKVQIGLAQYSGDPKTMWHLNEHLTRDSLLQAVANLPYKGGNTMTGMALNFILKNNFKTNVGMRPEARKIGVLITDGKSQDEIVFSSKELRDQGIELYAIGVKNADVNELRSIASEPESIHMYNVNDFSFLLDIVDDLSSNICNSVKGPAVDLGSPTNLVTSDVTQYSFRARWTAPEGHVDKYHVKYQAVRGGPALEVTVDQTSTVLSELTPLTEYSISVYAVGGDVTSEPLTGSETTLPLAAVRTMDVHDETSSTMRVRWEQAAGATGYRLLYRALNSSQPPLDQEVQVAGDVTNVHLEGLTSNTAYSLTMFALHGRAASLPLEGVGVTRPEMPAGVLRISGVTHSSMRLNWDAAAGNVRKYTITYKPDEGDAKETEVNGDITTLDLTSLTSQSEYDVAVTPVYDFGPGTPMLGQAITDVVPAPRDLQTSEVTQTSFRVTWAVGAPDVALYRVGWATKGNPNYEYSILSSDLTSHVLEALDPDTEYDVTVTAIYPDESESEDLIGHERTLTTGPPTNLVVINATTTSLTPKWEHAPGPVQNYKITYQPSAGGKSLTTQVGGKKTWAVLQKLTPDTPYTISVAALYTNGDSKDVSGQGKTKPLGGVRNLQVLNPTMSTLNVRWEPAEGKVKAYKVLYTPAAGGAESMDQVAGSATTTVLKGLQPDTLYTVTLVPVYAEGDGNRMSEDGKTKPLGGGKNLQVLNPTMSTLEVRWEPAEGKVTEYKVVYEPAAGGPKKTVKAVSTTTTTVLKGLTPDTLYTVTLVPVYIEGDGNGMSETGKTKPLGGVRNLQVLNPTMSTLNVRWEPAEGKVKEYKVLYTPAAGGAESMDPVAGTATSTVLRSLQPDTLYTVTLVPVYADGEGMRMSENGKTRPLGGVKNLRVTDPTMTSLKVDWEPADGAVRQYKVFFIPVDGGTEDMEVIPAGTTSITLRNLKPETQYTVSVQPVYPAREGRRQTENGMTLPLGGLSDLQVKNPTITTLTAEWEPADGNVQGYRVTHVPTNGGLEIKQEVSESTTRLLLDKLLPDTQYTVTVVPIYAEGDGPSLTDSGKTKPLGYARNLQVTDPTTSTLNVRWDPAEGSVREYIITWVPAAGGAEQEDQVSGTTTTMVLKNLEPNTEYTVTVVPVYPEMEGKSQSKNGRTNPMGGVKNLKVVDPTISTLTARWEPAPGNVRNYKVFYSVKPGGEASLETVSGGTSSVVLRGLDSDTVYEVAVVPVYPDVDGVRQAETGKTKPLSGVRNLQVTDPTVSTLRVRWEPAEGDVRQYNVIYAPVAGGPEAMTQVSGMATSTVLRGLTPETEYTVSLVPIYADVEGKRMSENGKTRPLGGVKDLQVTEPTTSSLKVRWEPAEGNVRHYRLFYVPDVGGAEDMEQVSGGTTNVVLRNLLSDMPYTVTVVPVYPEGEGLRQAEKGKTLPRTPPRNLQVYHPTPNSLNTRWEPASGQVQQYRVTYTPLNGAKPAASMLVPGGTTARLLDHLLADTPYSVEVVPLYADGDGPGIKANGKTLPRGGPRNMRVFDATTNTLTIGWDHAEGPVNQYKISYAPMTGDPITEFAIVPGNRNNALLQNLVPDTPYNITVEAVYTEGPGGWLNGNGRTVGLLEPRNLRVSDEWYTRFRVAWDPVASPVLGYKLVYAPAGQPQDSREVFVGDVTSFSPHNLQTGTTYDVKVFAQYSGGISRALEGQGTTLYLNVTGLETEFIGHDKYCIKWTAHRAATYYRIMVAPVDSFNKGKQEITFPAGQPRYCFEGLSQDALYTATVFVQTPNLEGPGVSGNERTLVKPTPVPTNPPTPPPPPTIPPAWAVCKGAKADAVFLIDGSWSIGEDSFRKVIGFVSNLTGAFDIIGPSGIQVSFVQYSDSAKTEFRLNAYQDKGTVLSAYQLVPYRGGNTKTGVALQHTYEKAFTVGNGMRRNVPKIVVAVTDGRSQDEVKKSAQQLQHAGYTVFVVGVADVDFTELQSIGSKPSERHVFVVDGFDAFDTIKENLVTFICETATSSCPLIYLNGFTSPGFRMLEAFNLTEKTYSSIRGVSMEPGSFNSFTSYRLHKNAFLAQPSMEIHPDGLPHSYTILLMFRLLPDSPSQAFDIWQISSKDHKPETGVTIDPTAQTVSFYNKDERGEIQKVIFDSDPIKTIFHGSFHKVIKQSTPRTHLHRGSPHTASRGSGGPLSFKFFTVLWRAGRRTHAMHFSIESMSYGIIPRSGNQRRVTSIISSVLCSCRPSRECTYTGKCLGAPGTKGPRGERGDTGPPGPLGPRGEMGLPGPLGLPGPQGPSGMSIPGEAGRPGPKGDPGDSGLPGMKGLSGTSGSPGPIGPAGIRGPPGKEGVTGPRGPAGPMGAPGAPGGPGHAGQPGKPGDNGVPGASGVKGDKGERGDFAPQNMMRSIARQVCEQLVNAQMTRVNSMINQIPSGYRSSNPGPAGPPGPPGGQGPRGEPGQTGRNGFPGSPGLPGQMGERGAAGEKGERGPAGVGERGQRGPQGPPGESRTGPPGPAGSPGARGPPGRQGHAGVRGPPGPAGYCDSSQCVGIPYNGQGYRDQRPAEPNSYRVPVREAEEEPSHSMRFKRSPSRTASKRLA
ncbi:unnamed protein product [Lota lota]